MCMAHRKNEKQTGNEKIIKKHEQDLMMGTVVEYSVSDHRRKKI